MLVGVGGMRSGGMGARLCPHRLQLRYRLAFTLGGNGGVFVGFGEEESNLHIKRIPLAVVLRKVKGEKDGPTRYVPPSKI